MSVVQLKTGGERTFEPLPEDTYRMRIRDASIVQDRRGNDQLLLVWEIAELSAEQEAAGADPDRWVRQWLTLYYGETRNGPSRLKRFLDGLKAQGLLDAFDPNDPQLDPDWLLDIEQRVTVDVNGQYNRVVMVSPPRKVATRVAAPAPAPAPAGRQQSPRASQPAARSTRAAPQPVPPAAEDEDLLF